MASRTKLREHRKTCLFVGTEMSKKKREKIKKEVKRENKHNVTRQRRVPPTDDEKRKMINEILNPTVSVFFGSN
jgi:phosphorylcholine metabolism protein LicD